jgi:sulfur-carrier protein adenylyltransferase/sulfurtransferase
MTFTELRIAKNPNCPVCGASPKITKLIDYDEFCGVRKSPASVKEVSPKQLKQLMDGGSGILLLDVREPYEYALCRIEGSKLIPLRELERRVEEIDRRSDVVVYCHVGMRSARAVELLSSRGFRARNLKGGIRAWAEEVDRSVPVY